MATPPKASTMKTTGRVTAVAAPVAALTTPGAAQESVLGGQARPRFERKTPMSGATTDFTSMRVRMRIEGELEGSVRVVLELQDVRLWGEETSTLGDFRADNLDLHQGYFDYAPNEAFSLRVNRKEISLGAHADRARFGAPQLELPDDERGLLAYVRACRLERSARLPNVGAPAFHPSLIPR